MKIIKGTEAIVVDHPVFMIFGQPGIGKSSLAYSTEDPLLLDFDKGAHRAANRRDTLQITNWADVVELMASRGELDAYATVIPDTVGRCLDVMTADIIREMPKMGSNGNLSMQGWGVLKSRFRTWVASLRALGKDVLLIAHDKEDKDGDTRIVRPEIAGGSYGEVMKTADFVGYFYMAGRNRILDFNPTDRWIGKNPAGWKPFEVPPIGKAQSFMEDLFNEGRKALGNISEQSSDVALHLGEWRTAVDSYTTAEEINRSIPATQGMTPIMAPQAKKILLDRAKTLGMTFDKAAGKFTAPEPAGAVA